MARLSTILAMAATVVGLIGCAGGDISNPLVRKFNWFHYVDGETLRNNCRRGALDQYRLVYNGNWDEQVRAYDLRASALGDGSGVLFTQVFGGYGSNVSSFSLTDPFGPARGTSGQVRLTPDQYRAVVQAIDDSGFWQPAPKGLRLESWDFYWVVSACVNGRFHFNAWRSPSERFAAIRFAAPLFAADGTGVPVNPPQPVNSAEEYSRTEFPRSSSYGGTPYTFELIVGENGLAGVPPGL